MKGANVTRTLTKEYNKVLDKYDVLVMPTIRFKAPKLPGPDITVRGRISHILLYCFKYKVLGMHETLESFNLVQFCNFLFDF